jgi:hypothetical protein
MGPISIVVSDELPQETLQLPLIHHDQMVETLPPEGAQRTLGDGIRPRGHHRSPDPPYAELPHPRVEVHAIDPIAVMN